jgi:hypothetical protein
MRGTNVGTRKDDWAERGACRPSEAINHRVFRIVNLARQRTRLKMFRPAESNFRTNGKVAPTAPVQPSNIAGDPYGLWRTTEPQLVVAASLPVSATKRTMKGSAAHPNEQCKRERDTTDWDAFESHNEG